MAFPSLLALAAWIQLTEPANSADRLTSAAEPTALEWIRPSVDGSHFVGGKSGARFVVWGVNYDHDAAGRLIEDYWEKEWATVEEDFAEIRALGANLVRIHLQLARFMEAPTQPNTVALERLSRLISLAEKTGLYLDLTGLGCYHKKDVPEWYDAMSETERWRVQNRFWESVASVGKESPAVFCYDLMNEPILPGETKPETEWLAGELGGKFFVQRITLDLAGRTRTEVAKAWVDRLVAAIRKQDTSHMITVGVIPWVYPFPKAQPLFYSKSVSEHLDFVSVHFYPKKNDVPAALRALSAYEIGKPLVIEEMFPLSCSREELDQFIDGSRDIADGWISFYWGKTIDEYASENASLADALVKSWLEHFRAKSKNILGTEARR